MNATSKPKQKQHARNRWKPQESYVAQYDLNDMEWEAIDNYNNKPLRRKRGVRGYHEEQVRYRYKKLFCENRLAQMLEEVERHIQFLRQENEQHRIFSRSYAKEDLLKKTPELKGFLSLPSHNWLLNKAKAHNGWEFWASADYYLDLLLGFVKVCREHAER